MRCTHLIHVDNIMHGCRREWKHDGEHELHVSDLTVGFESLDEEQIETIRAEANEGGNELPYTTDDIRRALFLALRSRRDALLEGLEELVGDATYEEYLETISDRRHLEAASTDDLRTELRQWTQPGSPRYVEYRGKLRRELSKRLGIAVDGNKTDKLLLGEVTGEHTPDAAAK